MVAVSVRIQHHPSRAPLADELAAQLTGFDDVRVIPDPAPAAPPSAWRAHRACLEAMTDHASHLLVLQDDAIPVPSFLPRMKEGIAARPESILLAFVPGFKNYVVEFMKAKQDGRTLIPFLVRAIVPVVAILYPADVVRGLIHWTDENFRRVSGADDGVVATYCRKRKLQPYAFVPSLCDHNQTIPKVGQTHVRSGTHRRAALL